MSLKLSVLIPMYNEEKVVANTARTLTSFLNEKFPNGDYEIIFSNDGSLDRSVDILNELSLPNVRIVGYPDNRGKGSAVREGILNCEGEVILYTDCDLAYGCDAIYNIYCELINTNSHLVIGSRNLSADGYEGYTAMRKLMSKAYIKLISVIAGFRYSDSQCGIKCLKKDAAKDIFSRCTVNGFAFDLEVLILAEKLEKKVSEFPVHIINHNESNSKVNPIKDALKMISDVMKIKKTHKKL